MATTFYLYAQGLQGVTPAFSSQWNETASAIRRECAAGIYEGTSPSSSNFVTVTSTATSPELHLAAQWISDPIAAQTITGTVTMQIRALESNANFNGTLQLGARVISDAGTVRGTLLSVTGSVNTAATPPEFGTVFTNRQIIGASSSSPLTLTSVTAQHGDRIVFEVGVRDSDTSTTRSASICFGGSSSTSDLPADNTTTAVDNPWIQLSQTIQFMPPSWSPEFTDGVDFENSGVAIPSGVMPKGFFLS